MKHIFEAENALEAHMISGLLEQKGIQSNINGEFLQGGVGDIQPQGFIRITVDDSDYEAAKEIITEWESKQIPSNPINKTKPKKSSVALGFLIGLALGVGTTYWAFNTPVYIDGLDHNRDGVNDEIWTYKNNRISKTEIDRNFDGKIDLIYNYTYRGRISNAKSDNNFDGIFETLSKFKKGKIYEESTDTNSDKVIDLKSYLNHDILHKVEIYDNSLETPVKVQHFNLGKLVSAELDSDLKGSLGVHYEYDRFEDISKKIIKDH